jgi:hypothetical protein
MSSKGMSGVTGHAGEYKAVSEELERESREADADRMFVESVLKREINWAGYEQNGSINRIRNLPSPAPASPPAADSAAYVRICCVQSTV